MRTYTFLEKFCGLEFIFAKISGTAKFRQIFDVRRKYKIRYHFNYNRNLKFVTQTRSLVPRQLSPCKNHQFVTVFLSFSTFDFDEGARHISI